MVVTTRGQRRLNESGRKGEVSPQPRPQTPSSRPSPPSFAATIEQHGRCSPRNQATAPSCPTADRVAMAGPGENAAAPSTSSPQAQLPPTQPPTAGQLPEGHTARHLPPSPPPLTWEDPPAWPSHTSGTTTPTNHTSGPATPPQPQTRRRALFPKDEFVRLRHPEGTSRDARGVWALRLATSPVSQHYQAGDICICKHYTYVKRSCPNAVDFLTTDGVAGIKLISCDEPKRSKKLPEYLFDGVARGVTMQQLQQLIPGIHTARRVNNTLTIRVVWMGPTPPFSTYQDDTGRSLCTVTSTNNHLPVCYRCCSVGHLTKYCRHATPCCALCGEAHQCEDCPHRDTAILIPNRHLPRRCMVTGDMKAIHPRHLVSDKFKCSFCQKRGFNVWHDCSVKHTQQGAASTRAPSPQPGCGRVLPVTSVAPTPSPVPRPDVARPPPSMGGNATAYPPHHSSQPSSPTPPPVPSPSPSPSVAAANIVNIVSKLQQQVHDLGEQVKWLTENGQQKDTVIQNLQNELTNFKTSLREPAAIPSPRSVNPSAGGDAGETVTQPPSHSSPPAHLSPPGGEETVEASPHLSPPVSPDPPRPTHPRPCPRPPSPGPTSRGVAPSADEGNGAAVDHSAAHPPSPSPTRAPQPDPPQKQLTLAGGPPIPPHMSHSSHVQHHSN